LAYPNKDYEKVLQKMSGYFKTYPGVHAIILTGSLARGKAVEGSCIYLFIFLGKRQFNNLVAALESRARAYSSLGGRTCYYEGELEGGILFGDIRVDIGFTHGKLDPQ
jgi:predicted nucleotidyltransferase